ncbi:MGST1-like protein [Mya arenaria]|uniref:Microsomal glutathione S-transferase 1 n=1 Tax=Mya arenaria TaxID=6604 RepID=A0ABY7GHS4_MYAAR|nr:microsomal glutathione S-transferase 1-like [Mya arenaria]WAR30701.1 MGST1-like protein [Mya arenaria]
MASNGSLSFENELFSKFAFYAAIVLLKTLVMSVWTARHRIPRRVFPAPEDYTFFNAKSPTATIAFDAQVERIRRCHLNDIENVIPFILIGLFYVLTGPDVNTAVLLFRVFAGARILHTLVYLNGIGQPFRAIIWSAGYGVCIFMTIVVIKAGSY